MLAHLDELITGSDTLTATKRAELRGVISTKPGLNRYLRVTGTGRLRIDHKVIKTETNLDGKYLLRASDPHLSAEDIALGYKQLLEMERGWRDMKHVIDLRPVYHRLEERIRAHVTLCWLALLLVRIIETSTGKTWPAIRGDLQAFLADIREQHYGYELMKITGFASGKLYPMLAKLQAAGWLETEMERVDPATVGRPARRWYRLNHDGVAAARHEVAVLHQQTAPAPVSGGRELRPTGGVV